MISSKALDICKVSVVAYLFVIVTTETFASSGFLVAPSVSARQRIGHPQQYTEYYRRFGQNIEKSNRLFHQHGKQASTAIRGVAGNDEQLKDWGGAVAGMFGNLRIPASLIAGASLGSAFALPMLDTDGFRVAFAKRMYAFSMITTLGSMLLVVILSTIVMNDISLRPAWLSKSVNDYIDENCYLEWMMVRCHFYYGALAFIVGSSFRAWVSIACPVFGTGIVGILTSLSMIAMSFLIEKPRYQTDGSPLHKRLARFFKEIGIKAKSNPLFMVGALTWAATVMYLFVKIPHMYAYLSQL